MRSVRRPPNNAMQAAACAAASIIKGHKGAAHVAPDGERYADTEGGELVSSSRFSVRTHLRELLALPLLLAATVTISAARTIEDTKLDPAALAPQCAPIDGEHAISIQARTHYANVEKNPPIFFKPPTRKAYQSFACGGSKSTIYYFEYASKAELEKAKGFTEGLIWGEKGPTKEHPELIVPLDNILVIISSREPDTFKKLLEKRQ